MYLEKVDRFIGAYSNCQGTYVLFLLYDMVFGFYQHQDDWRPTGLVCLLELYPPGRLATHGLVCLLELYPPGRLATHGVGRFTGTISTRTTGDPRGWYVYWNYIHQDGWRPTGLVGLLELYPPGRLATHGVGRFTGTLSTRTTGDPRGWYVYWNYTHQDGWRPTGLVGLLELYPPSAVHARTCNTHASYRRYQTSHLLTIV